jgi:hypothetical protein
VDPAQIPAWERPSAEVLERAARSELPLLLYFPDQNDRDSVIIGEDIANISRNSAIFVRFPYSADREKSPWAVETVVPTNKMLSDNPAREYNVPVGRATVILCDWYGNQIATLPTNVNARTLEGRLASVKTAVEQANRRLESQLSRARTAMEDGNRSSALVALMRNLRTGQVGYEAQEASIRLYNEIMDGVRAEMKRLVDDKDAAGLRKLQSEVRRTDVEGEIREALRNLN